jgi:hypothetical protein
MDKTDVEHHKAQIKELMLEQEYRTKNFKLLTDVFIKLLFTVIPLLTFVLFSTKIFNIPFLNSNSTNKTEMIVLQQQIDDINKKYDIISQELTKNASESSTRDLQLRIANMEVKQDSIAQTILIDPDKALTARLLRVEQKNLEDKYDQIKSNQSDLNNKFDNIILYVVAIPLGGVVLSLVSAFVLYLFSKFKTLKNDAPETK